MFGQSLGDNAPVPLTDTELVAAIESSLFLYPAIPGLTADLGVSGMRGRVTELSHPLANLCGLAELSDRDADATVRRVKDRFAKERKAFGWVTGPGTRPRDLERRLTAAGMEPIAH